MPKTFRAGRILPKNNSGTEFCSATENDRTIHVLQHSAEMHKARAPAGIYASIAFMPTPCILMRLPREHNDHCC